MTREEATQWFERMKEGIFPFSGEVMSEICDEAIKALSENKGEDRPKGEWIYGVEHGYNKEHPYCKCSECGMGMGYTEYDFCPNCGADMRGGGS